MLEAGQGQVVGVFGQAIETMLDQRNRSQPSDNSENRSVWMEDGSNAHPFLSNKTIRQAMSYRY